MNKSWEHDVLNVRSMPEKDWYTSFFCAVFHNLLILRQDRSFSDCFLL